MRLLLTVVVGAQSFEDVCTVNGVVCATYKEACFCHGLLQDDHEWEVTLAKAIVFQTSCQLHLLFATVCDYAGLL